MLRKVFQQFSLDVKSWILILVGSLTWSLTMIKSGLVYAYGAGFWGPNGHDGVWHIALIEGILRDLGDLSIAFGRFRMPVFSGHYLQNYHIGFDLFLALVHWATSIPIVNLYFQVAPPLLAISVGLLTYKFVYLWTESKKASFWSTFFVYFGGSLGWMASLIRSGEIGGESMFWSQQAVSTLINPPFAFSLVLILLGLIAMTKYQEKHSFYYLLLAIICFGVLIEVKAYAGILVIIGLFFAALSGFVLTTSIRSGVVKIFLGSFLISLLFYLLLNKGSENLLIFKPFWFLETMMQLTDRVGWVKFGEAMVNWRLAGIWVKAVPAYLLAFGIFWVGNMGTRFLAISHQLSAIRKRRLNSLSALDVFIWTIIFAGTLIPMFFLQRGTPWNTIQFFYYSLFFSGILVGIAFSQIINRIRVTMIRIIVTIAVIIFTIPTTIGTLWYHYLPSRPPAMISNEELEALGFLAKIPDGGYGVVLTYPFDPLKAKEAENSPPRPLYLYESTAYVAAFAKHNVYLEDEVNLDITGFDWRERRKKVEGFYETLNAKEARDFLTENGIKYVYWLKGQRARLGESQLGLSRLFENSKVDIYKVE